MDGDEPRSPSRAREAARSLPAGRDEAPSSLPDRNPVNFSGLREARHRPHPPGGECGQRGRGLILAPPLAPGSHVCIRGPESPGDTRRRLVSIRPAPIPVGTGPLRLDPALSSGKRFPVGSPLTRGGGQLPASRRDGTRLRSRTPNPWGSVPWPGAGRRAPGRPTGSWEPAWRPCPRRTAPPAPARSLPACALQIESVPEALLASDDRHHGA